MAYRIAVLPGDGCGPEVCNQALKVLRRINQKYGNVMELTEYPVGAASIKQHGVPITDATMDVCLNADAVLLGAVGDPKKDQLPYDQRPEAALFRLRKELQLYTNLRPVKLYPQLKDRCPLKDSFELDNIDMMIVRELTGGIYFGARGRTEEGAFDTEEYSVLEIKRILQKALAVARSRRRKIALVDKANVLETSRLWREIVKEEAKNNKDIGFTYFYVDNASMQLILNPGQFDVILTSNIFGDILSDEASVLAGSIGMLPSASLGDGKRGLYEPVHGSAPEIAGHDTANPVATILSAAMMLRYSLDLPQAADEVEEAVSAAITEGWRTSDIYTDGSWRVECSTLGSEIARKIKLS